MKTLYTYNKFTKSWYVSNPATLAEAAQIVARMGLKPHEWRLG